MPPTHPLPVNEAASCCLPHSLTQQMVTYVAAAVRVWQVGEGMRLNACIDMVEDAVCSGAWQHLHGVHVCGEREHAKGRTSIDSCE